MIYCDSKIISKNHLILANVYVIIECTGLIPVSAGVVELADTRDLKSRDGNIVPVQARSPAPETPALRCKAAKRIVNGE